MVKILGKYGFQLVFLFRDVKTQHGDRHVQQSHHLIVQQGAKPHALLDAEDQN
jgi:hypothetical protein